MRSSRTTTIGVSIAVPDPWGAELQDYRSALGDRSADGIPTHITLVPPLEVAEEGLTAVTEHLAAAAAGIDAFRIHLRGTGTFRPVSPVVFVTVAEGISACELLAASVRHGPLDAPQPFPYHPHVTVAHDLEDHVMDRAYSELTAFECDFTVDRFALYAHEGNRGWVPTCDFPLRGAAGRPVADG